MTHVLKGSKIWSKVNEEGLYEVLGAAGIMPLKHGQKIIWHACSSTAEAVTLCGIKWDDFKDPERLSNVAKFQCTVCVDAYNAFGEGSWEEGLAATLDEVAVQASKYNRSGYRH